MKNICVALLLFFVSLNVNSQCPVAGTTFATQAQLDLFPTTYPLCTVIPDGIDIKVMGPDINDLAPLSQLTGVLSAFEIRDCPLLTNLNGLNNITYVGNDSLDGFILRDLPLLNDITALNDLDSVTGEFTIRTCNSLVTLSGLNGVTKLNGSLIIRDNASLLNLNGLNALTYLGETLELVQNALLNDISALSNVNTIIGGIEGGVFIEANSTLSHLTGLGNGTTTIGSNLDLVNNGNLSICSVPSICNYLNAPPLGAVITISANVTNCNSEAEILTNCFTGVHDLNNYALLYSVYPNPVSGVLYVRSTNNTPFSLELYNILNSRIACFSTSTGFSLDVSEFKSGVYILKCSLSNGSSTSFKFIIP